MIPLSAVILQRSPTPPPGTTRLRFSVGSLGAEPVSVAFPQGLRTQTPSRVVDELLSWELLISFVHFPTGF